MMEHATKPIHISLTEISEPHLAKQAITMFKCMLGWAGERPEPCPAAQAIMILQNAIDYSELRAELYMQLLKQLCAGAGISVEIKQKYWDLLALALLSSPPGVRSARVRSKNPSCMRC